MPAHSLENALQDALCHLVELRPYAGSEQPWEIRPVTGPDHPHLHCTSVFTVQVDSANSSSLHALFAFRREEGSTKETRKACMQRATDAMLPLIMDFFTQDECTPSGPRLLPGTHGHRHLISTRRIEEKSNPLPGNRRQHGSVLHTFDVDIKPAEAADPEFLVFVLSIDCVRMNEPPMSQCALCGLTMKHL